MGQNVAILGASENPERFSYQALKLLQQHGHHPLPINPQLKDVEGIKVYSDLDKINVHVDTLTIYVNSKISSGLTDKILKLKPQRVIFNPGSENLDLEFQLKALGIETVEACTLVLLNTEQFDN